MANADILPDRCAAARQERPLLRDVVARSFILSYQEDVSSLENALQAEGLRPETRRARYDAVEQTYCRQYRCFLSHRNAWLRAAELEGSTLICEADFVPCAGLGGFPVFWPLNVPLAYGYLYQGSPRLLWLAPDGLLRAHAAPMVAYVVNKDVARVFLEFFDAEMSTRTPLEYFTFDAHLQWFVMGRGAQAFMPLRHYGEHGGDPQPEHRRHKLIRNVRHRADNLQAPLAFLPQYAKGSLLSFYRERIVARAYGLGRLFTGRWICETNVYDLHASDYLRMYRVGLQRLL